MDFQDFSKQIPKIKNLPLPGESSHHKMAPLDRIKELKALNVERQAPKKAGVMALFYPDDRYHTHLLLILRKTYPGVHSNQIGFPGGKEERGDANILETALRETEEEVGVDLKKVQVLRPLSEIYIPPSNFEVYPYLGLYQKESPFRLQESEVEALVEVPLDHFMDDGNLINQRLTTSYSQGKVPVPAFKLNGYTVWGATAMMLMEVKELFKRVL
ncbi:CoA pyrophosphatase [Flavobacteriaceae bacterium 3-367]